MLNSFGEFQRIILLGGKSDIGISILRSIPISESSEIFLLGRNMMDLGHPIEIHDSSINHIEIDFNEVQKSEKILNDIFDSGDVDLVIFAYAILGNEEFQLAQENFSQVILTNFYSQAMLLNLVYSKMILQMHGQILLISSVAGMRPRRRNFVYGTSKYAVDSIAQGLQKLHTDKNVELTILRPGFVNTKMTLGLPKGPFAIEIDKVTKIAAKGLKRKKRLVYAPKILLLVMFILKLLPERIFRIIDN
jgi:decaprenylphospho-beta-D-erythro-pentofuranosid-2-ulose 2-reductase